MRGSGAWLGAAAQSLGAYALPYFVAGFAAVLLITGAAAWLLREPLMRHARRWHPQAGPLVGGAALGFVLIASAAALFAELAEQVQGLDGPGVGQADEALAQALREHLAPATLNLFAVLTHLGDGVVLTGLGLAIALILMARQRRGLAAAWIAALAGNALLNPLLKRIFERVRPLHDHGLVDAPGWSFPSGHASGAMVAYGMLAYLAVVTLPPRWQMPAGMAAAAVIYTVGCSRVILQVHYASDVLAGYASGFVWLAVCVASAEWSRRRATRP